MTTQTKISNPIGATHQSAGAFILVYQCPTVHHTMSTHFPKKKMKVSWGEQWAWKEGEEEQTRRKKIKWKRKRKERRDAIKRERVEEYIAKQVKWAFHILKDERVAKYIIYACTTSKNALNQLILFLESVGITLDGQELPEALKSFRMDDELTLDSISADSDAEELLYLFFRVKDIRTQFATPGADVSPTDTDEDKRARAAAVAVQDGEVVKNLDNLPRVLQAVVADFTSRHDPQDQNAAGASLRNHLGLETTTDDDESETSHAAPSSPSCSEQGHGDEKQQEKKRPGESAVEKRNAKRQKTG